MAQKKRIPARKRIRSITSLEREIEHLEHDLDRATAENAGLKNLLRDALWTVQLIYAPRPGVNSDEVQSLHRQVRRAIGIKD